ncbi:MAG TPA: UDP-N-acetylmuramoyl-tripeptide--D-alanyl-D-alanine ligase [Smithellaceae bacterium]|nr:UDP-N-acetylmuramoyl-tripeptide--D-alanyl-D-alanine ligase [Smithellaceae bacterium]
MHALNTTIKRLKSIRLSILRALSAGRRKKLESVRFIAITGSAGKTMTKELTASILAHFGRCRKTVASYNMTTDVMFAVLHTRAAHQYCVAEIGAYGPGTMDIPVSVFQPHIAVLTLIGTDHISAYKSRDKLIAEKEKLIRSLPSDGVAVLNIDDPEVKAIGKRCHCRVVWFGRHPDAALRLLDAQSQWPDPLILSLSFENKTFSARTQLHGEHTATAVMASLGVALAVGLPLERALEAVAQATPYEGRMQPVESIGGVTFIRDDIKAPYWSLPAAFAFIKDANASRKVVLIGSVSDSSKDDTKKYKKICREARAAADLVIVVGPSAHRALRARKDENDSSVQGFPSVCEAAAYLQKELKEGDLVLIKGSNRADHLGRLILNRNRPIQCWEDKCALDIFCDSCPRLYTRSRWISLFTPLMLRRRPRDQEVQARKNP